MFDCPTKFPCVFYGGNKYVSLLAAGYLGNTQGQMCVLDPFKKENCTEF